MAGGLFDRRDCGGGNYVWCSAKLRAAGSVIAGFVFLPRCCGAVFIGVGC